MNRPSTRAPQEPPFRQPPLDLFYQRSAPIRLILRSLLAMGLSAVALLRSSAGAQEQGAPLTCITPPVDLTAWWPLDEISGTTAAERVSSNDGLHVNGPAPTTGMVSGALTFDGVDDYVEVAHDPTLNLGTGDFSIDFWVRTEAQSGLKIISDKRGDGHGYHVFLFNGRPGLQLADGSFNNYVSSTGVADGNWHLVAMTVDRDDPSGLKFYVDGQEVDSSDPTAHTGSLDNMAPFRLGTRSFEVADVFAGSIDEPEIFKRALTAGEVADIFSAESRGKCKIDDNFEPGRIILKFDGNVALGLRDALGADASFDQLPFPSSIVDLNDQFAATALEMTLPKVTAPGANQVFTLHVDAMLDIETGAPQYAADGNVEYAEPNRTATAFFTPNDFFYDADNLWGLFNIEAATAWDTNATGNGVVVAVIDSGVDWSHEDLTDNIWSNPTEGTAANGIDDDDNGFIDDLRGWDFHEDDNDPSDPNGHGTHVAGTVAASGNNNVGVVGVAFEATIMPLRGLGLTGSGSNINLANAIYYAADNGADIINNSWGGWGRSQLLEDAVNFAHSQGILVVSAAGNDNIDAADVTPANIENSMTVASATRAGGKSVFSNFGVKVDVAAPGGDGGALSAATDILSTAPDQSHLENGGRPTMTGGGVDKYMPLAGTSMATPHVSGLAALILDLNPTWSPEELKQAIRVTADDILDGGFDPQSGHGRINAAAALSLTSSPPIASIIKPHNREEVGGIIDVIGSAGGQSFVSYTVGIGPGETPANFTPVGTGIAPVNNGILASFDTADFPDGLNTLRLVTSNTSATSEDYNVIELNNVFISPSIRDEIISNVSSMPVMGRVPLGNTLVSYTLAWAPFGSTNFTTISTSTLPVDAVGPLGIWDLTDVPDGLVTLKLTADYGGYIASDEVEEIIVDKLQRPGWPVSLSNLQQTLKSPKIADLDGDGNKEVILGSAVFQVDGTVRPGWDNDEGRGRPNSAIADIDGDGRLEVIAARSPFVHAYNADKNLDAQGPEDWRYSIGDPGFMSSISVGDVDGDQELEVVFTAHYKFTDSETTVFVLDARTGTEEAREPISGKSFSSVALADLDGNGADELIVVANTYVHVLRGDAQPVTFGSWPQPNGLGNVDPVVGDCDQDGDFEILVSNNLWHHDGTLVNGWPTTAHNTVVNFRPSIAGAMAQLDRTNSELEVIRGGRRGTDILFSVEDHAGNLKFLKTSEDEDDLDFLLFVSVYSNIHSVPIVADVDEDGSPEIMRSAFRYFSRERPVRLYASNATDNSTPSRFPRFVLESALQGRHGSLPDLLRSSPAVDDLDGDGNTDVLIAAGRKIYAWDMGVRFDPCNNLWPMFQHDLANTGTRPLSGSGCVDPWVEDTPYNQNTLFDLGDEHDPNMTTQDMWLSRAIWVRQTVNDPGPNGDHTDHQNPEFGQTNEIFVRVQNRGGVSAVNTTVRVYYADASSNIPWDPNDVTGNGGIFWTLIAVTPTIPSLAPGQSTVVTVPWDPPATGHYCLLVRLINADDPMTFPETSDVNFNTRQNNNIAWRNTNVIDHTLMAVDGVDILLRNSAPSAIATDLGVDAEPDFLIDGGDILVDLGRLFSPWHNAGATGTDIELAAGNRIRILGTPATIAGIPMNAHQEETVRITTTAFEPVPHAGTSRLYNLNVAQIVTGDRIGGVAYAITARALDTDTDNDGNPDVTDLDDDNDGIPDARDADPVDPMIGLTAPAECRINLDDNVHNCAGTPGLSFVVPPAAHRAVVKLTLDPATTGFNRALFEVRYSGTPIDWTVNIGDSSTNNGFGGDSITQSNDAEMQIKDRLLSVYANQDSEPPSVLLQSVADVVSEGSSILLDVRNEFLGFQQSGQSDSLSSPLLYALDGQPDFEGPINYDIYAGFNRTIGNASRNGSGAREVIITLLPPEPPACTPGPSNLCLGGGRFRVEVEWRDFEGRTGTASVVPFSSSDSGNFWFFDADNWEMLVKILDACNSPFNSFWVFAATPTNVEFTLRVTDTATGAVREYFNPLGNAALAITDTEGFSTCDGSSVSSGAAFQRIVLPPS